LGIVVGRMIQDDPILEIEFFQIKGAKGISIIDCDLGRGTEPYYYSILKKFHDDF
jgi:hypothetical protein